MNSDCAETDDGSLALAFLSLRFLSASQILFSSKTIYEHGGHLGHVTSIMSSDFHFLVPESFHTKFGSEWLSSF